MAKKSINLGDIWAEHIRHALVSAKIVVIILTQNSYLKKWVLLEGGGAWFYKKKIMPLVLDVSMDDIGRPLSDNQGVPITSQEEIQEAIDKIVALSH